MLYLNSCVHLNKIEVPVFQSYKHVGRYFCFYNDPLYTAVSALARFEGSDDFEIKGEEKKKKDKLVEEAFRKWLKTNFLSIQKA